jgi:phospholipase/carboxylesterase
VLLTGLSDGGTFTLLYGLAHPDVFRALAPACGVLHPANVARGNLARARDVPVYLVHGTLDFLFPVALAHITRDVLTEAGAALTYRELPALSHTHPRTENAAILDWFEGLDGG